MSRQEDQLQAKLTAQEGPDLPSTVRRAVWPAKTAVLDVPGEREADGLTVQQQARPSP